MKKFAALVLATVVLAAAAVAADVDTRYLQGLGDTRYSRLSSETIGRDFHVYVMLPEGYDQAEEKLYPTVYVLDGGTLFPLLVGYYRYLRFGDEVPDLIIVGISYGSDRFAEGNYRATDYTAPSDEREYWGGAGAFQVFLKDELMPYVEREYRSRPDRRVVFGQSIGGQFVLYTALTDPGLYWGHIASNPALHRNLPFFLKKHSSASRADPQSRLFVGSASGDERRFRLPMLEWMQRWTGKDDIPWLLETRTFEGHSHMSLAPAAFRDGMRWLFPGQ